MSETSTVKVFTFDPSKEGKPRYRTFRVPWKGLTVLQVLKHIYEHEHAELAFRCGCDGVGPARCGACVVEVNDVPVLACQMLATEDMVIKAHRKFALIKDLVVDFEGERQRDELPSCG